MKKVFSPEEMKKIKKFLTKYNDPNLTTDDICAEIELEKETLLAYAKKHKLKIQGIDEKNFVQKIDNPNKGKKNIKPLGQIRSLIKEVDRQREQGIKVSTALKKVGSLTIGEYYYYKNKTKDNDAKQKPGRKPNTAKELDPIPTQPHVIEYVSVPNSNKGTIMVAIGSVDAVSELVARITQRS